MTVHPRDRHTAPPLTHAGRKDLTRLLDAVLRIGTDLDLQALLRRIVEAAADLVDARYGALGVLDESGDSLAEFITVGVDAETCAAIGAPPKGLGLLGAIQTAGGPVRVAPLREHPDSAGFPPNHPPMTSFLGVPVTVRGEVFGNLYLTDKTTSEVFTDIDEELVLGLAAAAGPAIENARLHDHARRREAALAATTAIATAVLAGADRRAALQLVAHHVREVLHADTAAIGLPTDRRHALVVDIVDGPDADGLRGRHFDAAGTLAGDVMSTGEPVLVEDASRHDRIRPIALGAGHVGPAVFVAVVADGPPLGVLIVTRTTSSSPFTSADLDIARSFADQAGLVLHHERARRREQEGLLQGHRELIGRGLQDTVVQRLFATGLALRSATELISEAPARQCVGEAVTTLDGTIAQIRRIVFATGVAPPDADPP